MTSAPSNLLLRHQTWYVVVGVPRELWRPGVKRQIVRTLGTRDKAEAMKRRFAVIADIHANMKQLAGAAPALPGSPATALPTAQLKSALGWRKALSEISAGKVEGFDDAYRPAGANPLRWARDIVSSEIADTAEDIEGEHGPAAAEAYAGIAHGTATPFGLHIDAWLSEGGRKGPLNPRTAAMYRSDLKVLEAWLTGQGISTLEAVTKALAGRYVSETMVAKRMAWATANRKITAPASYWQWLVKRGHAETSPWAGQQLAKPSNHRGTEGKKRFFTDNETATLLAGDAGQELDDAMRVAALSGMRLEEIYRLTVADCAGGWFNLRQSKTEAGVRRVPIHSGLAGIVARRTEGKAPGAFLFDEAGVVREGRERSAALSKRFGHYRQRVGVHERAEGKRHSAVDFHSFRRRFVNRARNAGIDRAVVAAVVGHTAQDITDGVYLGSFSEALLRACVEAVKLP